MYIDRGHFLELDGAHIPRDDENIDFQRYKEWIAAGNPPAQPPALTEESRIAALLAAVDVHLDQRARVERYDSIRSAALRAGYPGPFHAEGLAFATWMDACYSRCYDLLAQWHAGEIQEPTVDELIALLPNLELPD